MECCVSYAVDGNEPDGETALIDHLNLKFHDISTFSCSVKVFKDVSFDHFCRITC